MTNKTTWHHIRRSPFQSFAAILIVSFTSLLSVIFLLVSQGMSKTLIYFETKPEITIFLKDGLSKDIVASVQAELSAYDQIKQIRFISKEQALSIYQEQNKDNPLLLEMVTSDILPASFEVSANKPETLAEIESDFKTRTDVVDELVYQRDVISNLLSWTKTIRTIGLAFLSLFSLISFFIVFTIISMKITTRKEEIRISRLLGASKSYVKKPFIREGLFYGFCGSFIGSLVVFCLALYFQKTINNFFQPIQFIDVSFQNLVSLFAISSGIAIFITYFASFYSVKRYFKF